MVWLLILLLVMRRAARSPATATAAVPEERDRSQLDFSNPELRVYNINATVLYVKRLSFEWI